MVHCKLDQVAAVKQQLLSSALADAEVAIVAKMIVDQAFKIQLMTAIAALAQQVDTLADGLKVLRQATDMGSIPYMGLV